MIFKQNSFSRSLINDKKMGAYYTDLSMCRRIGQLFQFPKEEVCILEPSIGDGEAVFSVIDKQEGDNKKVFGVELNTETYQTLKGDKRISYLTNADFLSGMKISHNAFSFCFANPPYGVMQDEKERYEISFMRKIANYLQKGAYFVLVIPYYVLLDEKFLKVFLRLYQPESVYRFDDVIYEQFKQVVVIATKKSKDCYITKTGFWNQIDQIEKLPYLPQEGENIESFSVSPSFEKDVEYFSTLIFNVDEAGKNLAKSELYSLIEEKAIVPPFRQTELGCPPVPLKKDLLYLCALSGGGQGLVGSLENQDLHLQRGVVKVIKQSTATKDGLIESSFSRVSLNLIENDGTITVLV